MSRNFVLAGVVGGGTYLCCICSASSMRGSANSSLVMTIFAGAPALISSSPHQSLFSGFPCSCLHLASLNPVCRWSISLPPVYWNLGRLCLVWLCPSRYYRPACYSARFACLHSDQICSVYRRSAHRHPVFARFVFRRLAWRPKVQPGSGPANPDGCSVWPAPKLRSARLSEIPLLLPEAAAAEVAGQTGRPGARLAGFPTPLVLERCVAVSLLAHLTPPTPLSLRRNARLHERKQSRTKTAGRQNIPLRKVRRCSGPKEIRPPAGLS